MNDNLRKLAKRRELLVARAEAQRLLLSESIDAWRKPLAVVNQGLYALRYVKNHPLMIVGGGAALLSILRPSGLAKWLRFGWLASLLLRKYSRKSKV